MTLKPLKSSKGIETDGKVIKWQDFIHALIVSFWIKMILIYCIVSSVLFILDRANDEIWHGMNSPCGMVTMTNYNYLLLSL